MATMTKWAPRTGQRSCASPSRLVRWGGLGSFEVCVCAGGGGLCVCGGVVADCATRRTGTEMKCGSDDRTGIIYRWEVCEGKAAMSTKKFCDEHGAGTACVLRMVEPLLRKQKVSKGSTRDAGYHYTGDSAFASVATAVALDAYGVGFSGPVKTASKLFPKAAMLAVLNDAARHSGKEVYLEAKLPCDAETQRKRRALQQPTDVRVLAVGWRDKTSQIFVTTRGTSEPGTPSKKLRRTALDLANADGERYELAMHVFGA